MTRRDFELLARVIRDAQVASMGEHVALACDTAAALALTNPRFDRARFVLACRPSWVVGTRHDARWERAAERS